MAKNKAQLEAELKMLRYAKTAEGWIALGQTAIRWGAVIVIAYFAYKAIAALAGASTSASIVVEFLADLKVNVALAWCVGLGGVVYGKYQNKLRKDTVERLQNRVTGLELTIDEKRSSSNLTPRGDTRPEDRL